MRLVVDSSALAKRYVQEEGSQQLEALLRRASELAFCIILVPEVISGMNRRLREQALIPADYRRARDQLLADTRDATVLQVTPRVVSRAVGLLERTALRAMDALHVACALEWGAERFVTADTRQQMAAVDAGLNTDFIGPGGTTA